MDLIVRGNAKSVLSVVKTVKEAKDHAAQWRAVRDLAKQSGLHRDDVNRAAERYLWSQYAGGRLLLDMRKAGTRGGGRKRKELQAATLSDLEIEKTASHRWQKLASIPEREFEAFIRRTIDSGEELTTAAALGLVREAINQRKKQLASSKSEPTVVDESGKSVFVFDLLLADPPWQYDFSETKQRDIENHYPTASCEAICAHCMEEWFPAIADSAVLFLWATAPKLPDAIQVLNAWGFAYKTHAVWDKEKIGMGYWFRGQHELLLVGTRGSFSPPDQENRVSSVFREARGRHSAKPECVYAAIEAGFPNASKCELYQRTRRRGWRGVTNEQQ